MNKKLCSMVLAIMLLSGAGVYAGNKPGYMTPDQKDALDEANSPSSSNPLATQADVTGADTGVQTVTPGVNLSNSGDVDNPIFDLDISEDVDMNTSYQLKNLAAPSADGMAIRQTSKISETILEANKDKIDGIEEGATADQSDTEIEALLAGLAGAARLSSDSLKEGATNLFISSTQETDWQAATDKVEADSSGWDEAYSKAHTQGTDQKLDDGGVNEVTAANAKDAVDKKHTQNTDSDLDPTFEATFMKKADNVNELADITSAGTDIEDAVTKKHTQGTDQKLDDGGGNEVTAAELRTHLDNLTKHREIDDASTADTKLWSASKINTELHWVDEVPLPFRMTWDDGDTYLQHFQIRVGEGNCADTGVYVVDKESKDDQANWIYFSPNNVIQIPAEGVDYLHNHLIVQYTTGQSVLSKNVMYNIWKRAYNATDSVYGDWDWLGSIIK